MRTKIKLNGTNKDQIETLLSECVNNNQIIYHLKNNPHLLDFLKIETGLDKEPMVLLYHFKECIKEVPLCICGKERKYHCYGYRPTCADKKCQNQVREESKKKFCLEKYGVEFVTQLETMKEKSKQSCLDKFGVDNCTKSPEIIKKRKDNNFKKYGVSDPIILKSIRGKTISDADRGLIRIQDGLPVGYNVIESDHVFTYTIECSKKHTFRITKGNLYTKKKNNIELCNLCNEYVGSNGEQDVYEYISTIYDKKIIRSDRKLIKPFEIDMILEDIKICIEFNGDYWHSNKVNDDMYYHLNKLNMCLSKGYKLFQIRENDWNKNKDIIKKKIFNIINNIIDYRDFDIRNGLYHMDLSWYDDRIVKEELEVKLPSLIKVGQYEQWDCGYKICR
jgi:very-short-patch-repair endonuclease